MINIRELIIQYYTKYTQTFCMWLSTLSLILKIIHILI